MVIIAVTSRILTFIWVFGPPLSRGLAGHLTRIRTTRLKKVGVLAPVQQTRGHWLYDMVFFRMVWWVYPKATEVGALGLEGPGAAG